VYLPTSNDSCYTIKWQNNTSSGGSGVGVLNIGANNYLTFEYVEWQGTGLNGGTFPNNSTALAEKETYTIWHPYPLAFSDLYEKLRPLFEAYADVSGEAVQVFG
jgi:hypothetical protein